MPGLPFAAFGAGLGQGVQGIDQHNNMQIQQLLSRLAADKQRRDLQAEQLIGSLPGSVFAGNQMPQGQQPMGRGGMPGGMPSALPGAQPIPQAPAGGGSGYGNLGPAITDTAARGTPLPQWGPQGATPIDTANIPPPRSGGPTVAGPRTLTPEQQDNLGNSPHDMSPEQAEALYRAAGAGESRAGTPIARTPPPAPPSTPQASASPAAPRNPGEGTAGDFAKQPVQFTNPIAQSLLSQAGSFPTFGDMIDRMRAARPDADPGVISRAAQLAYTMIEKGSAAQQNLALRALTQLRLGEQFGQTMNFKREAATGSVDGAPTVAQQRATTAAGGLGERKREAAVREGQRGTQIEQNAQRIAQAQTGRSAAEKRQALNAVLRDIQKQLYPGFGNASPSDEDRERLTQQQQQVQNELRKMGGLSPISPPSKPLPGGGAEAPIPQAQ